MTPTLAQRKDNSELLRFYESFISPGLVDIKTRRSPDFFMPYSVQSLEHLTYKLEEDGRIEGMASFLRREVFQGGHARNVTFGKDLRISHNRKAVLTWGQYFLPLMKEVQEKFHSEHLFSILSQNEVRALNAFVRPRASKRPLPRYYLYRRFNLVSLHGQFPWATNPLPHLRIRRGGSHNVEALIDYISRKSESKDLASVWNGDSFWRKLRSFPGLELESFLIAYDGGDNIIGCLAPWSSKGIQEFIPLKYSLVAHNFRQFLKFGKILGWTRPLTKPVTRLKTEAAFEFRYLNFLHADNEDIFAALLWAAFQDAGSQEFLVYTQMRTDLHLRRPLAWISARVPHSLYCLVPPDQEIPQFLSPSNDRSVELEPFYV